MILPNKVQLPDDGEACTLTQRARLYPLRHGRCPAGNTTTLVWPIPASKQWMPQTVPGRTMRLTPSGPECFTQYSDGRSSSVWWVVVHHAERQSAIDAWSATRDWWDTRETHDEIPMRLLSLCASWPLRLRHTRRWKALGFRVRSEAFVSRAWRRPKPGGSVPGSRHSALAVIGRLVPTARTADDGINKGKSIVYGRIMQLLTPRVLRMMQAIYATQRLGGPWTAPSRRPGARSQLSYGLRPLHGRQRAQQAQRSSVVKLMTHLVGWSVAVTIPHIQLSLTHWWTQMNSAVWRCELSWWRVHHERNIPLGIWRADH